MMRRALAVSVLGHALLAAGLLAWHLHQTPPKPDITPQVEVMLGGGGHPTPQPPTPGPPPQPPHAPATPASTPSPPTPPAPNPPAPDPAASHPPMQAATAAAPSPPPSPEAQAPVRLDPNESGPLGSILDPNQTLLRPAQADTGNRPPDYPPDAVRAGQHGTVTLRLHIAADGTVARAQVAVSSGTPSLDQAAVAGITAWHFKPALRDGVPVPDTIDMAIEFRLP